MLGQELDALLMDRLRELKDAGLTLRPKSVMGIARALLESHSPHLLMENGGSVEIRNTWAKSFLKRI